VRDLELEELGVRTAFIHGTSEEFEEGWTKQPEQLVQGSSNIECKLLKSMYGLKKASRAWHKWLQ
jgi:hypothetical protein